AQRIGFDGESIDRAHATAQRDRIALVTVAIRIRVVDEAAGEHRRRRAQARLEAIGRLVAVIRAEPRALESEVDARAEFAQVVRACAEAEMRPHAALRATREDLDDAADRVGAVKA